MGYSITGLILLVTDVVNAVTIGSVGAVVHTINDAEEASSLVESIQALLRAGEKNIAKYLIRDLKTLVSDLVALYATGAYVSDSASALKDALRNYLWELDPERVRRVIETIEDFAEEYRTSDLSDATMFLKQVLGLLNYDVTASRRLKETLLEGLTPEEALHTALVALVVSVGGVAWDDEIED